MNTIHIANNHAEKLSMGNKDAASWQADKACHRLQQSFIRHTMASQNQTPAHLNKL